VVRESDLRFETYVEDAAGWLDLLAADARFSGLAVTGHSEGSLIGMLAAKGRTVKAFVSIAGPAQGASSILRQQLHDKLPPELAERNEAILLALEQGRLVDDTPVQLTSLYRPSVQPYLVSWFRYVPAEEIKGLRIPCLILQGDADVQVPVSEARALKAAAPQAQLQILQGMNHVLKLAGDADPAPPLAPELGQRLARFLADAFLGAVPVTLTPAEPADVEALVALRIEAMRESLERAGRFDPVRARERFLSGFSPAHTRHIEAEGSRMGFVVVKPQTDHLLLDHLYIRPGDQGKGIGSAVLAQVLQEADALRLPVRVGALRGSDSNRFYARHGFQLVEQGEFDNYYIRPAPRFPAVQV
jgi:pimeloyl-ACP methyl ester carboxylesterase/predicted N-acetyltransferase YhbS